MRIVETRIPGPLVIEPEVFSDERDFFLKIGMRSVPPLPDWT